MKNKNKEKQGSIPEPMAVVYGPPPRPPSEESMDLSSLLPVESSLSQISPPDVSAFNPIPSPSSSKKKITRSKEPIENPEDRIDVYGPPPPDSLFGDD